VIDRRWAQLSRRHAPLWQNKSINKFSTSNFMCVHV
jgi:hypothetical protein